jgi:hypothetical protein
MRSKTELRIFPINVPSLAWKMAIGGLIGLVLIGLFLYPSHPNPEWGRFWWIRPFIAVPVAGALGGVFNYFVSQQTFTRRWVKIMALILSLFVFLVALWMGTVVGLDGTYWD